MIWLVLLCFTIWLFWKWWTMHYSYWKKRGFPALSTTFPWGTLKELSIMTDYQGVTTQKLYHIAEPHPFVGIVLLRRPYILARDPEFIKLILVKDFSYFHDRVNSDFISHSMSHNLLHLSGDAWRVKRVNLGHIFSKNKMKQMMGRFDTVKSNFYKIIESLDDGIFDADDLFIRFSLDFIGSWAVGSEINSLVVKDHIFKNESDNLFPPGIDLEYRIKLFSYDIIHKLEDWGVGLNFLPNDLLDLINRTVKQVLQERQKTLTKGNDFVDVISQMASKKVITADRDDPIAQTKQKRLEVSMTDLTAESVVMFAGFRPTSLISTMTLYELAKSPEIQERLIEEIDRVTAKHGGLTYDAIQDMTFLDQVFSEVNRLYPPLPILTRKCTKNYEVSGHEGLIIEKGTRILIPVYALHRDPKLFPDPEKFDPERFSEENKNSIVSYSYLPFGEGPHFCIGRRIGTVQCKMSIALTLSKYRILTTPDTPSTIKYEPTLLLSSYKHPIWLKAHPRLQQT